MVQTAPVVPNGPGDQATQGGPGGQVVRVFRVTTLDAML